MDSQPLVGRHEKRILQSNKDLQAIFFVNDWFCEVQNYIMYSLTNKSSLYDNVVDRSITKYSKRLKVHMKSYVFYSFDFISIISCLAVISLECNTNGLYKGTSLASTLLHGALTVSATLITCGALRQNLHKCQKEATLASICGIVNSFARDVGHSDIIPRWTWMWFTLFHH